MATLSEIEAMAKTYSLSRAVLSERVQALEAEIEALKRKRLPGIKRAVEDAAEKQARLQAAVEGSPELFVKPRTMIFHGIKLGFQKSKGRLEWASEEQVVRLIRKHYPEQADTLIKVTEKPVKSALLQMSAQELKKIGVTVKDTGDQVVVKSTDSEIDKLVSALLKGAEDSEERKEVA